jgi:hypothetical protein
MVVELEADGQARVALESDEHRAFRGGCRTEGGLLLATEVGVATVSANPWSITDHWTHPWCNDVHGVLDWGGAWHVVSTGLDAILEVREGEVVATTELGAPFDRNRDWRGVDTKPHAVHPNHVFAALDRVWCTRFHQRDAVSLGSVKRLTMDVGLERAHDGVAKGERVWFSTVDGHVVGVHPAGVHPPLVHPVGLWDTTGSPPGWCRGLGFAHGLWWVGFTRIRATRFRSHLAWARGRLRGAQFATSQPTHVVGVDVQKGRIVHRVDLEELGMDAVFSILP